MDVSESATHITLCNIGLRLRSLLSWLAPTGLQTPIRSIGRTSPVGGHAVVLPPRAFPPH
ncbi:hypothetical protein XHV734_3606 [Xanthomonas hortorum pv. vitians]|nr:hypothetical protein XHV734_3606 [Xanthomonas hortorum pv. vitians]